MWPSSPLPYESVGQFQFSFERVVLQTIGITKSLFDH